MMKENLPPLVFEELWHKEEAKNYKWRLVPTKLINPLNYRPLAALYPTALRLICHRKIGVDRLEGHEMQATVAADFMWTQRLFNSSKKTNVIIDNI